MSRRHPLPTPFPYTTLFRSAARRRLDLDVEPGLLVEALLEPDEERRVAAVVDVVGEEGDLFQSLREACARHAGGECKRSEEHTSELQSQFHLVCRLLLEKKK